MNPAEQQTTTVTLSTKSALRRPAARSLVLAQSWVPFSVAPRNRVAMRASALKAAEAFTLLSSELATRRGETNKPTA